MTLNLPVFADVEAAAARIAPYAVKTPLIENAVLNDRLGARVFLKLETLQRTGSFKFRGALNKISQIAPQDRVKGVIAFSSGNHAQGVAAAAALFSIPALIVMPKDVPAAKLEGTKSYGAEVVFYDRLRDDREAIALALCEERGAALVRPFDDPDIVAGQGTIGLEIAQQAAARGVALDAVLAPCSGGGLVSGIALAISAASPGTHVVSVEPENYDGMRRSLAAGKRIAAPGGTPSIADALMAPIPGEIPFALAQRHLTDTFAISDDDLTAAVAYAARTLKLIVEPSGTAGLAALMSGRFSASGKVVTVVLTGANCDFLAVAQACAALQ
ncbi:MAG: threonine/serine dehydratase [Alphaproteobacteria bacterium]|nr:threonine/serine dehydratase [Alphaproteobacteria bacterium]MDE2164440.1 threonine/serine dehydratase [Alphaproteobacteria bacterium]MDE2264566.1 threonine/serine dehydratase [Alphaproteobacteria bacterium]MDE2499097.1 threonine/serine dehydratase [Alphaproteobacteria bacterium]